LTLSPIFYWINLNGNWNKRSIVEERNLVAFPKISFRMLKTSIKRIFQGLYEDAGKIFFYQFINKNFQSQSEKAAADQILCRISLVEMARFFERIIIKSIYLLLPDGAYPASMKSGYYITRDEENLLRPLNVFSNEDKQNIDFRITNYKDLLAKNPKINFFVYNIEIIEYSKLYPISKYFPNADNGQSLQYFIENKPEGLIFKNFRIDSLKDFKDMFFKTDHHWNIHGALKAYDEIYQMLIEKYSEISPKVEVNEIKKVDNLYFLGSYARITLYPIEPDILEYADYEIEDYATYIDNKRTIYGNMSKYLNGTYSRNEYFNHYQGFYGEPVPLIHYHFSNESNRNLLMITSSYARMIQMMIASHFKDTYVIDLRFKEVRNKSLEEMILDYGISDVIIFGQPSVTYYSKEDSIKP